MKLNLKELDNDMLFDLLSEYTNEYTKISHEFNRREELATVKNIVDELTEEIELRKRNSRSDNSGPRGGDITGNRNNGFSRD